MVQINIFILHNRNRLTDIEFPWTEEPGRLQSTGTKEPLDEGERGE